MTQIIDGKRYNTETATEVASYWNGRGGNDFRKISETLYHTPKGAWFMQYDGGALTEYREEVGQNSWCGGSGLRALSPEAAFDWLQTHAKTEALEIYFSDRLTDA